MRYTRNMEILSSRVLLMPRDADATLAFYRDKLGLAIAREYPGGTVFFAGQSLIEIAAHIAVPADSAASTSALWLQVRDIAAAHTELEAAGVRILRAPQIEPWGLHEMHIADPDDRRIIVVEVPADHPIRRDVRPHK